MTIPIRITVVMTHPIQYYSPWFRFIENDATELALSVLYVSEPSPQQQGAHFGERFQWDVPLRDGYENVVLRRARDGADFGSESFWSLDHPGMGDAIASTRPDVVLLSGWHSASLVRSLFACRRLGIPLLYRGDSHLGQRARSLLWRARSRFLLNRFDGYLSVGVRTREYLEYFGVAEASIYSSPHAVDNEFFAEHARPFQTLEARAAARAAVDVAEDAFVVLFVGKLEPRKRFEDLIGAMALMQGLATLMVVGGGPLEAACRERADALGVDVRWCGFLNQSELGRAYGIADCLALPSASETWGLVVNESMACGLPCVVSDRVGCSPDLVVGGRTGEVFPCGDLEALAAALERVRGGSDRASACVDRVDRYSFRAATKGLVDACRAVT